MLLDRLRVRAPGALHTVGLAVIGLWPLAAALAQPAAPAVPAASAPSAEMTPAERAKRDGDKVFHWILIHADKPRKPVVVAKEEKPMPVVRLRPATRPAADEPAAERRPSPAQIAVAEPSPEKLPEPEVEPAPAPVTAPVTTPSVAAEPVAAPAVAVIEEDVAELLKPVSQVEPSFPVNLVRTLRIGQVKVMFTVLPDGSVAEPSVVGSSNARLNAAALAAVAQWRFAPVRKPQHGLVDLGFNIGD